MNTNLFCPKCTPSRYVSNESNTGFIAMGGDLCASCCYQYKSGDHQRKQLRLKAARLALKATQNGSQIKAALIYALLGIFIAFIAYNFFHVHRTILGFIFSAVAFVLLLIAITGLIFTPKRN